MRVLFITHYLSLYGANKSLLGLVTALGEHGVDCRILVTGKGAFTTELDRRSVRYYTIPFEGWAHSASVKSRIKMPFKLLLNLILLPYLVLRVRKWSPDLVYSNSSVVSIGFFLAKVIRVPHVWHMREFGWLDYNLKFDFGLKISRALFENSSAVICVSEAIRKYYFEGTDSPNIHVIYNGVVSRTVIPKLHAMVRKPFSNPNKQIFSIVGLVSPTKGQEDAVRAITTLRNKYPNVRLLIAGDGNLDYIKYLKTLANPKGYISYLGYIPDPFEVYSQSDAVLVCSKNEAFGRTTAEAMAAMRPVIGYDSGGTAEIIRNGTSGLLYKTSDDLVSCMAELIANPSLAMRLGQSGGRQVVLNYTIEKNALQVYDVLKKVTGSKSGFCQSHAFPL